MGVTGTEVRSNTLTLLILDGLEKDKRDNIILLIWQTDP